MEESTLEAEVLWAPSPEMVERSQLARYIAWLAENRDLHFEDYAALWRWSVTEIEEFWRTIWDCFEVLSDIPPDEVLPERIMPGAKWFPAHSSTTPSTSSAARPTTRWRSSTHPSGVSSPSSAGASCASASRPPGGPPSPRRLEGDRVVAYLPNGPRP